MSKKLGDMGPEERDAVIQRAVARFQDELDATAPAIGRVLCPHTNVREVPVGDADCQSGTRIYEVCRDCDEPIRDYPLPVLL